MIKIARFYHNTLYRRTQKILAANFSEPLENVTCAPDASADFMAKPHASIQQQVSSEVLKLACAMTCLELQTRAFFAAKMLHSGKQQMRVCRENGWFAFIRSAACASPFFLDSRKSGELRWPYGAVTRTLFCCLPKLLIETENSQFKFNHLKARDNCMRPHGFVGALKGVHA